ncbi:hypothetical protein BGZ51_004846 [Haplosporangium sp. Z 767]|nr:hypothetical protein BGZ51_004846 [Haplosporangium sp. Z 767]KAF9184033.1 hypothetical protein BGZ50_003915 [Haplosporangium sp. Z 11]
MYEGLKIIVTGWLLLAHFYLSKPDPRIAQDRTLPSLSTQDHYIHTDERIDTKFRTTPHEFYSPTPPERLSQIKHRVSSGNGSSRAGESLPTLGATTNLDFGRFKRNLERRQSSSIKSDPAAVSFVPSTSLSRDTPRARSKDDPSPIYSSSIRGNPFKVPTLSSLEARATPRKPRMDTTRTSISTTLSFSKKSPDGIYQFGTEKRNLKRPLSVHSPDIHMVPPSKSSGEMSTRDQFRHSTHGPKTAARRQPRTNVESFEADVSAARSSKRKREFYSPDLTDRQEIPRTRFEPNVAQKSPDGLSITQGIRSTATAPKETLPPSKHFSRPKPPGKNRKALLPHPSTSKTVQRPDSRHYERDYDRGRQEPRRDASVSHIYNVNEQEQGSASFESRMKHVRNWIKERNPSMISPTLTASSDNLDINNEIRPLTDNQKPNGSRARTKRKAYSQLAPHQGSKRVVKDDEWEHREQWRAKEASKLSKRDPEKRTRDRLYPELDDNAPVTHHPSHSQRSQLPTTRFRDDTQGSDPAHDPQESSSYAPPVDWSRFQQRHRITPKNPPATPSRTRSMSSTAVSVRKTPSKRDIDQRLARVVVHEDHVDGNPTISPLIKLRQSQLKQRQQEDFLGIKRKDDSAATGRSDEEGAFLFNQALDTWEREDDDETLARNAASEEAAEAEARRQRQRNTTQNNEELSPLPSENRDHNRDAPTSSTRPPFASGKFTPTGSLLRAVPFNGESSRRPVPDLKSKKSPHDVNSQPQPVDSSAHTASTALLDHQVFISDNNNNSRSNSNNHFGSSNSMSESNRRFKVNLRRVASSLPNRNAQSPTATSTHAEDTAHGREGHPGLYTPSKRKQANADNHLWGNETIPPAQSTPTVMSRYIQLSTFSDEDSS